MAVIRPFISICLNTIGIHCVNGEASECRRSIRDGVIHTLCNPVNGIPASCAVTSTENPAGTNSLGLGKSQPACSAEGERTKTTLNGKNCFTIEGFASFAFIAVISCETLFKDKADAVTVAEIFNTS